MKYSVSREQKSVSRYLLRVVLAHSLLLTAHAGAADATPARLFFSDAKVSFVFPSNWTLQPSFPYGPLFSKVTKDGSTAWISCAISAPLQENRVSSDISQQVLKQ